MAKLTGYPLIFMVDEVWINTLDDPESKANNKLYRLILEKSQEKYHTRTSAADRFQSRDYVRGSHRYFSTNREYIRLKSTFIQIKLHY